MKKYLLKKDVIKLASSVNFIINPVGKKCNLSCKYCYNKIDIKHNGEMLCDEKMKNLIDKLNMSELLDNIRFTWHGGEPLLWGWTNYESVFNHISKTLNKNYSIVFQTNATLIDQNYIYLFKKHSVSIGVSLDGFDFSTSRSRFKSIEEYNAFLSGVSLLKKNNIEFATFTTLLDENIDFVKKLLNIIKTLNPTSYTLNPIISKRYHLSVSFWTDVLMLCNKFYQETGIKNSHVYHVKKHQPGMCQMNGLCQKFLSISSNGDISRTCKFDNKNIIGNIDDVDIVSKIEKCVNEALEFKNDSFYARTKGKEFEYFQGNGCEYRKKVNVESNDSIVNGLIAFKESL